MYYVVFYAYAQLPGVNWTRMDYSIEYGSEVWEGNKGRTGSLESVILDVL